MKTITISIDPLGKPTIEANGFTDSSCASATKPIEDALAKIGDGEVEVIECKASMHVPASTANHLNAGGY